MPIAEKKPVEVAEAEAAPVNRHHNEPPLEERIAMEFRDALLEERPQFIARLDDFITAVDRAEVTDDETLGKAGDLDKMLRAAEQHVNEVHEKVKRPYLDAGRAADAEKKGFIGRISNGRFKLRDMMNGYMAKREAERRAEEARIAAEQRKAAEEAAAAERARQEALGVNDPEAVAAIEAVALAPAETRRAEPVRSDAGSTVSARTVWNSDVEDFAKAFKAVKGDEKVQQAIRDAVQRLVRAGQREIPGTRIWSTQQAVAR